MIEKLFSQKDPTWKNDKLGTCAKETIGSAGCKITCYGMFCGKTPREVNKIVTYTNGCLTVDSVNAKELGLEFSGKVTTNPTYPCIAETNHYKSSGYPQHFYVLREDGKIADPLDYPCNWKKNPYNIVSYRLFKNLNTPTMNKDFVKEVGKLCGEDYGSSLNENEQKDAAKKLKEYHETYNSDEIKDAIFLAVDIKEKEMQAKLKDEQKAYDQLVKETNNTIEVQKVLIDGLENNLKNLKDGTPYIWNGDAFQGYTCDSTDDMTDVEFSTIGSKIVAFFNKLLNK